MRVALVYDEPLSEKPAEPLPEDHGAEYEDERTIEALLQSIRASGHEALGLAFGEGFPAEIQRLEPDLVFNIAEGVRGPMRESIVPAWLDHLGIPYTGSNGLALAVSLDKALTKTLVAANRIRTPAFRRVRKGSDLDEVKLHFPLFVKPNAEGSSMGIRRTSRVETADELERQVAWIFEAYEDCLVEAFVPGREFCVGVLGNEAPRLLPTVEVRSPDAFYHHEHKRQHRKELVCPADIPDDLAGEMQDIGLQVFRALGCRDLARVDLRLDVDGHPVFLEINPLPGLSPDYGIFTCQAEAAGLSHHQLIGAIIECALSRACNRPERIMA